MEIENHKYLTSKSESFHFRQFSLYHSNSTMKVGTDAILLAVWCDIEGAKQILDVGTGSGVIALLLATRSNSIVDAVEPDKMSVKEAQINFSNFSGISPTIYCDVFSGFVVATNKKYDLIVSNPPFFTNNLLPNDASRKAARHTNTFSHNSFCDGVTSLLSGIGKFCLVLPYDIALVFINTAEEYKLHLHKKQIIFPKPNAIPNRINMEFRLSLPSNVITEKINIRNNDGTHSNQYKGYVGDYLIHI